MANAPDTLLVSGPFFQQVAPATVLVTPSAGGAQQPLGAFLGLTVANSLTAAGTTQATALQLTALINDVTTWAAGAGVNLPAASTMSVGQSVIIFNDGAGAGKVYTAVGDTNTIDGTAGATGVALTNASRCEYFWMGNGWKSAKLGAVSS